MVWVADVAIIAMAVSNTYNVYCEKTALANSLKNGPFPCKTLPCVVHTRYTTVPRYYHAKNKTTDIPNYSDSLVLGFWVNNTMV